MDVLHGWLSPFFLQIKFVHLLSVMIWLWSASIAYSFLLVTAWKEWRKDPANRELRGRRDWVFFHYERGLVLEHSAMVVTLITGPLLIWLGDMDVLAMRWMLIKVVIVVIVLVPLEIMDSWLAHFGGNKRGLKEKGVSDEKFEEYMQLNWLFLKQSAPIAVLAILITLYLAVVKPAIGGA